jgi:hypothetical protein
MAPSPRVWIDGGKTITNLPVAWQQPHRRTLSFEDPEEQKRRPARSAFFHAEQSAGVTRR